MSGWKYWLSAASEKWKNLDENSGLEVTCSTFHWSSKFVCYGEKTQHGANYLYFSFQLRFFPVRDQTSCKCDASKDIRISIFILFPHHNSSWKVFFNTMSESQHVYFLPYISSPFLYCLAFIVLSVRLNVIRIGTDRRSSDEWVTLPDTPLMAQGWGRAADLLSTSKPDAEPIMKRFQLPYLASIWRWNVWSSLLCTNVSGVWSWVLWNWGGGNIRGSCVNCTQVNSAK